MSAVDELLEFLKIVSDDLKRRGETVPISLLKLYIYCDKYFNKFEIRKFKAFFKDCRGDLLKLSEEGRIYFPYPPLGVENKDKFFAKMDDLEKRTIALDIARKYNDVLDGRFDWRDLMDQHETMRIIVSNVKQRIVEPSLQPIFKITDLARTTFVEYEAVMIERYLYAVLPGFKFVVNKDTYEPHAIGFVFDCPRYDAKLIYKNVRVAKPALFLAPDYKTRENWQLLERGELNLGKGELSESEPLKVGIIEHQKNVTWEEAALIATVNKWWQDDNLNRMLLRQWVSVTGLPMDFYSLEDFKTHIGSLRKIPYKFKQVKDGAWLLSKGQGNLVYAVPADYRYFTRIAMVVLKQLFDGFDKSPDQPRFGRVYRACQLQQVGQDIYDLREKGYLLLHGHLDARLPLPPSYETLIQQMKGIR